MLTLENKSSKTHSQDHYLLPDSGASAKLPTYEECVKADKNILVNIGDNGEDLNPMFSLIIIIFFRGFE